MGRNWIFCAGLILLIGTWGQACTTEEKSDTSESKTAAVAKKEDPHTQKPLTPDEFGSQLFAVLKGKDYDSIDRWLWHEQDWAYMAELGHPVPEEKQKKMAEEVRKELHEGITRYHEQYFMAGSSAYGGEPIRTVEYVRFIPGRSRQVSPRYVQYNDSYLVIKINGSTEERLEIDHIQVIDGVWRISEIR